MPLGMRVRQVLSTAMALRTCYAMSGTDKAQRDTLCAVLTSPYEMSGTYPVSYTHLRAHETEADL
eukprot:1894614-Rhodomonas_salina.1